ncbi:MAG: nucleoside hydrolase-like domain-containing protein [Bacteroidota bacterium]
MERIYSLLMLWVLLGFSCSPQVEQNQQVDFQPARKIPVIILTDINNAGGDPDDKQSWIHVLWYADVLDIRGLVPDYWTGKGYEAAMEGLEAYESDFKQFEFAQKGYPMPDTLRNRTAPNDSLAVELIYQEAMASSEPLYILIWGQMKTFRQTLFEHPEIADKVRVLTIGTGRKYGPKDEVAGTDCNVVNWNGPGRNDIYDDPRFHQMWWLENNWTYNGMFSGTRPAEMFDTLATFGAMGAHIKTVVKDHPWAQYFRVGDTPTVLYLIDENHNPDDPTQSSWAGKFAQPFPDTRPNYYTDDSGNIEWDYTDPCNTWENLKGMYAYNKSTLEERREEMYEALLEKLNDLYN